MYIVIHPNLTDVQFCDNMADELVKKLQNKRFIVEACSDRKDGFEKLDNHRKATKYYPIPRVKTDMIYKAVRTKVVVKRPAPNVIREVVVKIPIQTKRYDLEVDESDIVSVTVEEMDENLTRILLDDSSITLLNNFELNDEECNMYTDASYRPMDKNKQVKDSYGCGVYIEYAGKKYYISGKVHNDYLRTGCSYAEIVSLLYCLFIIKEMKFTKVNIFYDAEALMHALTCKKNNGFYSKYRKYLYEVSKLCDLTFIKVKGHSVFKGNNIADSLALSGIKQSNAVGRGIRDVLAGNMSLEDLSIRVEEAELAANQG